MGRSNDRIRPAHLILAVCSLALLAVGFLFLREAPVGVAAPVQAIRFGVEGPIACHDPATCMASGTLGQARLLSHAMTCISEATPSRSVCSMELEGLPLSMAVQFTDGTRSRITRCLGASYNGEAVACQAIFHYPTSEVALGTLPGLSQDAVDAIRSRYPLSQLGSGEWWFAALGISVLIATVIGCLTWLLLARRSQTGHLRLAFSSGTLSVLIAGIALVILIGKFQFPID